VGDHLAMLQYATYFVISPEGCANIIWKDIAHAPEAAEAMGVTSKNLQDLGIVDATIPEPLGGAHRDVDLMAQRIREHIITQLERLQGLPLEDLLAKRYQRLMSYGN
jgi:acetyl-CoA carboxylase carboxyl transferase subunit alpha